MEVKKHKVLMGGPWGRGERRILTAAFPPQGCQNSASSSPLCSLRSSGGAIPEAQPPASGLRVQITYRAYLSSTGRLPEATEALPVAGGL